MTSERIYPDISQLNTSKPEPNPRPAKNFPSGSPRFERVQKYLEFLEDERKHYSHVRKKYNRAYKSSHWAGVICGGAAGALSSGAIATALTGVGIVATSAVAGVAGAFGMAGLGAGFLTKKFESKVQKHTSLCTLIASKQLSLAEICEKVMEDGSISKEEMDLVAAEITKYLTLKSALRAKKGNIDKLSDPKKAKTKDKSTSVSEELPEKPLEEAVRTMREMKAEFEKKLEALGVSQIALQ